MVKVVTDKINNVEEDRKPTGEEKLRGREETTPPRELWTTLIEEENSRELETLRHQEITRMNTESKEGMAEGKGEGEG